MRPGDPARVGPYAPLALLGSGGMGRVYLARTADGGPGLFAVKVIRPEYTEDPRFRRRFEREATVHARAVTPYTPKLHGTGFQDELLWMATEYLPGVDLATAVRGTGALQPAAVWRLVAELAATLAGFATAGIVHRDLKPSNVLLSVRGTHVIDFGISKALDASSITGTGDRVGTPAFMSPEYLRTGGCTPASDMFSLAGTLVYAATGHAPFGDGTGVDVMHRVAFEEPNPELLSRIAAADPGLGALLTTCLAKDPADRPTPQSLIAEAATHALPAGWPGPLSARVLAGQRAYDTLRRRTAAPPPAQRPPTPEAAKARPWPRRRPALAVAAGVSLCLLTAGILVLTRQDGPATASPDATPLPTTSAAGNTPHSPSPGTSNFGSAPDTSGSRSEVAAAETTPTETATATVTSTPPPSATGTASPPATTPTTTPATAPWLSDCTHYSGNGRTRRGDTGKRVLQVQCMLAKRGYDVGSAGVDGTFGEETETAVRAFQTARGLTANGIVAVTTWTALRDAQR